MLPLFHFGIPLWNMARISQSCDIVKQKIVCSCDSTKMSFSERLIEAFDGATMAEISRRLSVPHSTIRNYVQHDRLPAADVLITIANNTNVSIDWLLTGRGQKRRPPLAITGENYSVTDEKMSYLQGLWRETFDEEISDSDLIRTLISRGEASISVYRAERFIDDELERTIEFAGRKNYLLARAIIAIVKEEILDGDLSEAVRKAVTGHAVQEFGTIDEDSEVEEDKKEFELESAVKKYDNALPILQDWYRHDGLEFPNVSIAFSGWEKMSVAEKVKELRAFRGIHERQQYRRKNVPPKDS